MYRTLQHMGLPEELIHVHHLAKGTNVHTEDERRKMSAFGVQRVIVLDQGSRPGDPIVTGLAPGCTLIIDHHMSTEVSG
jgi:hypothetical protein